MSLEYIIIALVVVILSIICYLYNVDKQMYPKKYVHWRYPIESVMYI